ncbi:G protein gamma subunit Gpg1 [Syncephalastrum racemosum]|uniref:Guanine nucleotide-binding protein subunit gamma n=1 Tax=Syncephalastrum racemosum TaxID=13706 RepID=A0A1X2HMP5_SYNRA|nr:G protein gamma subunit Gpg1 [Syncephalastrum racemosum]
MKSKANQKRTRYHLTESKLKKIEDYTQRLRTQLDTPREPVSVASKDLLDFCNATYDPLVPSVWGPLDKQDDPFAPTQRAVCCSIL